MALNISEISRFGVHNYLGPKSVQNNLLMTPVFAKRNDEKMYDLPSEEV